MATAVNYGSISTPPSSPSALRFEFLSRAAERSQSLVATRRPWTELADVSSLSRPSSYSFALSRVRSNLSYFRVNYLLVIFLIIFLSLLWHPISLIVFLLVFSAWLLLYFSQDTPLLLLGRPLDDRLLLTFLCILTILALAFSDVGSNLLLSLLIATAVVGLHAAFRDTDNHFVDEHCSADQGPISVVGPNYRPMV